MNYSLTQMSFKAHTSGTRIRTPCEKIVQNYMCFSFMHDKQYKRDNHVCSLGVVSCYFYMTFVTAVL